MNNFASEYDYKTSVLEKMFFGLGRKYTIEELKRMLTVEMLTDEFAHLATLELRGILYGTKKKLEEPILVPDGKWEMFKFCVLPTWLQKKFPTLIKTKVIHKVVHIYNSYPHIWDEGNVF